MAGQGLGDFMHWGPFPKSIWVSLNEVLLPSSQDRSPKLFQEFLKHLYILLIHNLVE